MVPREIPAPLASSLSRSLMCGSLKTWVWGGRGDAIHTEAVGDVGGEAWGLPSIHLYLLLHKNLNVFKNGRESGEERQAGWFGLLI